jgi:VWFA-related protein
VGALTDPISFPGDGWSVMRNFPEAKQPILRSNVAQGFSRVRNSYPLFPLWFLLSVIWILFGVILAPAQATAPPASTPSPTRAPETQQSSAEVASHDEPATFKLNAKLVVVRAVVRDSQGHAVGTLHQEDFQVFDKGKPQVIAQFDVEQPGAEAAKTRLKSQENSSDALSGDTSPRTGDASAVPERFVAYLFDDVHLAFGDLANVREAAKRHLSLLRPADRAAIFTTSGQTMLDYTDDHAQLLATLLRLQPRPIARSTKNDCPDISYYQADRIVNLHDDQALQVGILDALSCTPSPPGSNPAVASAIAQGLVQSASSMALSSGDQESRISLGLVKDIVSGLSHMPGQRSLILISPGFITPRLEYEYTDIVDRAVHAQVVINTLDARGLYVPSPMGDASVATTPPPGKDLIEIAAASANDDILAAFADGTGGVFFHNSNDFDDGFRRVAEAPEYAYVLAFSPQNLKLDGSFHSIKVTLKDPQKFSLQARRGYYAPKSFANPEEEAKQEIEDEMFSQEELHNLPVNLHTQFFKASDQDAKLVVLAHVDVKRLRFRKVDGRNDNVLTCVSALFSRNGSYLQGTQKIVTMHWKDETLQHKLDSGLTLKTSFDVKPGSYLVRLVVRDEEGKLMSAENGAVEIR